MKGELTGGCLCQAVRYTLRRGFRMRPYACHCTDCQTRTGSAFSLHMLFMLADLSMSGETDTGAYVQPSGGQAQIHGCGRCMVRIYAVNDQRPGFGSLRCGTLDNSASVVPAVHLWVSSKQPWIVLPDEVPALARQPRSSEEWMELVRLS